MVTTTEHGKDKFNIVPFLCNCSIPAVNNTKLLHSLYLFLPHHFDHFLEACSFDVCSLYVNVFGNSLQM